MTEDARQHVSTLDALGYRLPRVKWAEQALVLVDYDENIGGKTILPDC